MRVSLNRVLIRVHSVLLLQLLSSQLAPLSLQRASSLHAGTPKWAGWSHVAVRSWRGAYPSSPSGPESPQLDALIRTVSEEVRGRLKEPGGEKEGITCRVSSLCQVYNPGRTRRLLLYCFILTAQSPALINLPGDSCSSSLL